MEKDVKILGLVLVGLFVIFLISGSITGEGILNLKFLGKKDTTVKSVPSDKSGVITAGPPKAPCVCSTAGKEECRTQYNAGTPGCVSCCYGEVSKFVSPGAQAPTTKTSGCISKDAFCAQYCGGATLYSDDPTFCAAYCMGFLDGTTGGQVAHTACYHNCLGIVQ